MDGAAPCPDFSAQIWVKIFAHLTPFQLSRARLVCRRWCAIICAEPALMGKFTIVRVEDFADEEEEEPANVNKPAALNALRRYLRAYLLNAVNKPLETSWLALGENLRVLTLEACCIGTDALVGMLRNAPNLECLTMNDRFCFQDKCKSDVSFKMERLQKLDLRVEDLGEALRLFGQICKPLRTLKVGFFIRRADDELMRFLQSMLATLEEFQLRDVFPDDGLLQRIVDLDWQALKKMAFSFKWVKEPCYKLELHNLKVDQVELTPVEIWNEESLNKFRSFLPFLHRLILDTALPDDTFVQILPATLHHLSITFSNVHRPHISLNLGSYHNSNLTVLKLSRVYLPRQSFRQCCQHCPNIHNLSLGQCEFEDAAEMSSAIAELRSLATLTLLSNNLSEECPTSWTVKELKLYSCFVSEEVVGRLFRQCPQLKNISFDRCNMTGSTVAAMWEQFGPQLKIVRLNDCRSLGNEFVECFLEQCCQLEQLTIWNCRLSVPTKQRLRIALQGVHLKLK